MDNNHQNALPYLKGLIGRASEMNMSCLMLCPPELFASTEEVDAFLDEHIPGLHGLIHLGAMERVPSGDRVLRRIMERTEIPQVCVSGFASYSHIGAVFVDPVQGMEEACAFLQTQGCKSLGVITSSNDWPQSPFTYIAQFRDETMTGVARRHGMNICGMVCSEDAAIICANCVCEELPGGLTFTEEDGVLALTAPRALMTINGVFDPNPAFNPAMTRRCIDEVRRIYRAFGVSAKLRQVVLEEPHSFSPEGMRVMLGWFDLLLKGKGDGEPSEKLPEFSRLPEAV